MAGIGLSWSRHRGQPCLRVKGADAGATLGVWPAAVGEGASLPAMAGSWVSDGDDRLFLPRFAFVAGESYVVAVDGERLPPLSCPPGPDDASGARVAAILPSTAVVPRNVLRFYIWFSAPMSEGAATSQVALLDARGAEIVGATMPADDELWDPERRRLTVLMDPARIKRGLVSNQALGYPLDVGQRIRLVVARGFPDARGAPLREGAERSYLVGPDERRLVEPRRWRLRVPGAGTTEHLAIEFDRPLDHALLARCLELRDRDGGPVAGRAVIGNGETSWLFEPARPWTEHPYQVAVRSILEDLAGNSLQRIFDRDLGQDPAGRPGDVMLPFRPRS